MTGKTPSHVEQETGDITATNIVSDMLRNEDYWTAEPPFVAAILRGKKDEDCVEYGFWLWMNGHRTNVYERTH